MTSAKPTTLARALQINEDPQIYGAFAEIGAGQEVARFFFQAGQASQTIAKTMSAYDMIYSDEIYGKEASGRYVCESRLVKMLDKEFSLLHRRLDKTRGNKTKFFAFANTVASGSSEKRECHGWMGVRFQSTVMSEHTDIVMHVKMLDKHRLQQQEMLGVLGVNLVATAFQSMQKPENIIPSLIENIKPGQVAIDFIRVSGANVSHINNHLLNLELVRRELSEAILFGPDESILNISDTVWDRSVIVERGSFRPVSISHLDILEKGVEKFKDEFGKSKGKQGLGDNSPLVLFEMTMHTLQAQGSLSDKDFLDRVRTLASVGHHVLVSNFLLFYRLKRFLRQHTQRPIAMIVGANLLNKLFDDSFYKDLEGRLLEGLGKLMDPTTHLYIYPSKEKGSFLTSKSFKPPAEAQHIFEYFLDQGWMSDMKNCESVEDFIRSDKILELIKEKNSSWEKCVPKSVRDLIKDEKMFGFNLSVNSPSKRRS